jgi:peptidyl-prolyl cis-trans isomerase D
MLNTMRKYATGWVVKVLFGLLIVSFAVWGIGDVLRAPQVGAAVAKVAGSEVEEREVLREFDERYRELVERAGGAAGLTRHQAVTFGLMNQALDQTIARRLVDAHAKDLGLTVSEAELAASIRDNPALTGPTGFDKSRFDMFLRSVGLSEKAYVEVLRQDTVRARLVDGLTGPAAAPAIAAERILAYQGERRRGRALVVQADDIQVPEPDEAALKAYLEANARRYEAPELRDVTLVVVGPDELASDISLADADLRAEYEHRLEDYRTPAGRSIEQLLAADEAVAKEAAARVAGGESLSAVAAAMPGRGVARTELGPLRQGDLPEELDKVAFALAQGAVSPPVQTPFGWHVVRVTEVRPEALRPFEEVRAELEQELRRQRAGEQLPAFATRLDDEVAGGATLEAAAERLGVPVLKAAGIDRQGQNEKQEAVAADRLVPDILEAVFAGTRGDTSLMRETKDGRFFQFRVDEIRPARPRGLDEVREVVAGEWRKAQRAEKAKARAEELRARITDAASFDALAVAEPGTLRREVGPLGRSDQGFLFGLGPDAVAALFATPAGAAVKGVVTALDGSAVLVVDEVTPAAPGEGARDQARSALTDQIRSDLLQQYEAALRRRYEVTVNQQVLARMMEAQADNAQQQQSAQ